MQVSYYPEDDVLIVEGPDYELENSADELFNSDFRPIGVIVGFGA